MFKRTVFALTLLMVVGGIVATCDGAPFITEITRRNPDDNSGDTEPVIAADPIDEGSVCYVDRTHEMAMVAPRLLGAEYVQMANDDKDNPNHEMDVTIGQACRLYLLIDNRMGDDNCADPPTLSSAGMDWVTTAGFVLTASTVEIDETPDGTGSLENTFSVYEKAVTPGTYTLYGQDNGGSRDMYVVAAALPPTEALNPDPADGVMISTSAAALSWEPGVYTSRHHVYLSSNLLDVQNRTAAADKGLVGTASYIAGGLVPGNTYYWAVDEVNDVHPDSPWAGDVWNFSVISGKAINLSPLDGARYLPTSTQLQWSAGYQSLYYEVYYGTDFDTVNNATTPNSSTSNLYHALSGLTNDTTYYWRIDAVDNSLTRHKGDVWSFSTIPVITVQDPNLVAWYKFDAGYGTKVLDWSGYAHDGTINGTVNWVGGLFDNALEFTGDNGGYVEMPASAIGLTNSVGSVAMWVNSQQIDDEGHIWYACDETGGDGFGGQDEIHVNMDDDSSGIIRCFIEGGDGGSGTDVSLTYPWDPVDQWVHVAATWDESDGLRLYINGVEVASAAHNNVGNLKTYVRLRLGHANSGDRYYEGLIDDFRLFDCTLTAAEVVGTMRGDPLVAWNPKPGNGAGADIENVAPLTWSPGDTAVTHDVYFGTDMTAVSNATTASTGVYIGRQGPNNYYPTGLSFGATYYWRVDEIDSGGAAHKGYVWSFTVLEYLVVEDFEIYGDSTDIGQPGSRMWYTWRDGYGWTTPTATAGNGTGSSIGNWPAPVAETTVVHGGNQSMPFWYDNSATGTDALGTPITARYSETERTFSTAQSFIRNGVRALSLWFQGFEAPGSTSIVGNTITITGSGADIWSTSDEFHFAYKPITVAQGVFTLKVYVESVENTNAWAKAGIMVRDSLDPDSANTLLAVTVGNGTTNQIRPTAGDSSTSMRDANLPGPAWIALTRDNQGDVRGYYSTTGTGTVGDTNWTQIGTVQSMILTGENYIGLAVTSHSAGNPCTAVFSNFTMNTTSVTGLQSQDIGITTNDAEPLYAALTDSLGHRGIVYHPDADAVNIDAWTQWDIDLKEFQDQGVNLSSISKVAVGVGVPGGAGSGSGKMYFDDITLYPPRLIPGMGTPIASDFDDSGHVDFGDVEILSTEWLRTDYTAPPLLTWYKLDGDGQDSSGNNHHADPCSDPGGLAPSYVASMTGFTLAVDVNGGGDCLIDPDAGDYMNGLDAVTIMAWVKSEVIDTDKGFLIFEDPAGNDSRDMRYDAGGASGGGTNLIKVGVTTTAGEQKIESQSNVQTTAWQHVALTWSSGQDIKLYLDGVENTPSYIEPTRVGTLSGYSILYIGKGGKDASGSWAGLIDDVRIYDKALSQAELSSVLNGTLGTVSDYHPLVSPAELVSDEPTNSKAVNFRDLSVMLGQWFQWRLWPDW